MRLPRSRPSSWGFCGPCPPPGRRQLHGGRRTDPCPQQTTRVCSTHVPSAWVHAPPTPARKVRSLRGGQDRRQHVNAARLFGWDGLTCELLDYAPVSSPRMSPKPQTMTLLRGQCLPDGPVREASRSPEGPARGRPPSRRFVSYCAMNAGAAGGGEGVEDVRDAELPPGAQEDQPCGRNEPSGKHVTTWG